MKNIKSKFSDFELETITKQQQKAVRGGDDQPVDPYKNEPKNGGGGNGNG